VVSVVFVGVQEILANAYETRESL